MKPSRLSLILGALLIAGPGFAEDAEQADGGDVLIATVNGIPYSLDLFRLFYLERLQQGQGEDADALQETAFNDFMSLVVASQEATRRELEQDENVATAVELQRMKILSNAALASMSEELEATEDELQKAYEELRESARRTEYKARHILVKEETEAKKLIAELDGGADFGDLAREHSLGPTGKNGGELDWFDAGQMVAPFSDAVAAMEVGAYSKEPVRTEFGWHVINLQDSRKAEPPSFEEAKPRLTAMIKRRKLSEKLIAMRDSAMVELNEDVVKLQPSEGKPTEGASGD